MAEDKQSKINDILDNNSPWQKPVIRVLVICLVVMLVLVGGFVAYLQINAFDMPQQKISVGEFVTEQAGGISYGEKGFVIQVPKEVINGAVEEYLLKHLPEGSRISGLAYDSDNQRIQLNYSVMGFYLPVSFHLKFSKMNHGMVIAYDDLRIGKNLMGPGTLFRGLVQRVSRLDIPIDRQSVVFSDYGISDGLAFTDLQTVKGLPVLTFKVDESRIRQELVKVRQGVAPRLLDYYKTFDSSRTEAVLEILDDPYEGDSHVIKLINSFRTDQYMVNDLILISEGYDTEGLMTLLSDYNTGLDLDRIIMERKAFKGHAIDDVIASVFTALDTHFSEKMMAFNQGKPFDIETMKTMTVKNLNTKYHLGIDKAILPQLSFIYDDAFKVVYQLDEDTYYIRSIEGYEVVTGDVYAGYLGSGEFLEPRSVEKAEFWDSVVTAVEAYFNVEELFVRYMKTDGQSTFTVVSLPDRPQEYHGMALQLIDGEQQIIEARVKTIAALIEAHPGFNVATATRAIETTKFKRIGDDIKDLIIEELYGQRKITSKQDTSIVYSAYDGKKYIAFKLSNGDEYVYKVQITVYGTYLADLYTKEKAKRNWSDIPELLLLVDRPEQ